MSFISTIRLGGLLSLSAIFLLKTYCEPLHADDAPPDDTAKYGRKLNDEERLAALEMLAKAMRENYEKIKTWKGEYHFIDRSRWPNEVTDQPEVTFVPLGTPPQLNRGEIPTGPDAGGGHWIFRRGTFRFNLDQTKGKYYVFYDPKEPTGILDVATGREGMVAEAAAAIYGLLTPEHALTFNTRYKDGIDKTPDVIAAAMFPENWKSRIAYRYPAAHGFGWWALFDTRAFFRFGARSRWEINAQTMAFLRGEHGEEFRKSMDQGLAIYVSDEMPPVYTEVFTPSTPGKGNRRIYVYDGKSGFNVVRELSESAKDRFEETLVYRKVSEVFLPEKYDEWRFKLIEDVFRPDSHRTYELLSTEINQEIPESDFDIKQFGLIYGDRMVDQIPGQQSSEKIEKLYIYDDKTGFVPVAEFQFDPSRVPQDEK